MKHFDPTDDITNVEASKIIQYIIENGSVIFSEHARTKMQDRNFDDLDIINILENGTITDKQFDSTRKNWKYRVEGMDIEGVSGIVITAIISNDKQIIVTAF